MSFTYDANGNTATKVISGQTTSYTWDYENKLTRIDYPNGSSNIFTTNADGVRMTANDSGGNRRFIYDGTSIVGEQDIGSGNLIAVYDHGNGGLVRQVRGTGASYYQYDGLGSTRQLTDANQAVTDAVSYDAWGNVLSSSGATVNAFKYVGRLGYYADNDNGLMLLGARYYGSGVGRFWSVDPIGLASGELNPYVYCLNDPINHTDPFGLQTSQNTPPGYIEIMRLAMEEARQTGLALRQTSWWNYLMRAGGWYKHHIFPRQFRNDFMKVFGKDLIDKWTFKVPDWFHYYVHHGLKWNSKWQQFFDAYKAQNITPSVRDVLRYARELMNQAGLRDVKWYEMMPWK
jgi:RHS repeat-associated protein